MTDNMIRDMLDRRCSRNFVGGTLPEDDIETLVEVMRWAPSAGNLQPWFFYIVLDPAIKSRLVEAAHGQRFIADAAAVFVICAIPSASAEVYRERGSHLYCIQDTAAAAENLMLGAQALGYGACWVGAFDEVAVREILSLPATYRPVAIMPVGPCTKDEKRTRRYGTGRICEVIK
jgi:nitroreductase